MNRKKCKFNQNFITSWGTKFSSKGVSPNSCKVDTLHYGIRPNNKDELWSFLGITQANANFIPAFSTKTFHMEQLLKKNTPFQWDQQHEKDFHILKTSLHKSTLSTYFDPTKHSVVYFHGHTKGLSAKLCQINSKGQKKVPACDFYMCQF